MSTNDCTITLHNINEVLDADEPTLSQNLTKLFAKLLERNQDPTFVHSYVNAIRNRLFKEVLSSSRKSSNFSTFGKGCYTAGIARTLLEVVTSHVYTPSQSKERCLSQHVALRVLSELIQTGNRSERRALLEEMKKHHVIKICLSLLNRPLCIFRALAVSALDVLATEAELGENLPAAETAEIIVALCKFSLEGPELFIEGIRTPTTAWQSQIIMGTQDVPTKKAVEYAPRSYALAQESALHTAHELLHLSPMPSRKYCLDILKKRPEILDLLFDCAIIGRSPAYPETKVDHYACEVIGLFFQWPSHVVPGIMIPQDNIFRAQEWKSMSQAVSILTYREDWCEKIIEIWMKSEEEDWSEVRGWFGRAKVDYHAINPPDDDTLKELLQYRGITRITILRLISTLTHAAESCGITNVEIESLLRVAYLASRKVKDPNMQVDAHLRVPNETIMGSTALARLLVVLARRKAFDTIQGLKKAPQGLSSSTCLNHVQQITNPDVIRRFLKISLQRVRAYIGEGRDHSSANENAIAMKVFMNAAELAIAVVTFDTHTQDQYSAEIRGARKELIVALGNAAEMAIRDRNWQQALYLASGAVGAAEDIPDNEQLDGKVVAKNKRRVEQARVAMAATSGK